MQPARSILILLLLLLATTAAAAEQRPSTAQPNVQVLPAMAMPGLDRERAVRIYLPPSYQTSQRRRYPVLYMHDGQNLFDAATAFGGEWEVDETLNALAKSKKLELIVVGVDNGQDKRMRELNPWDNTRFGAGEGREYMKFVVEVVKPYIDAHYRTQPDRAHTAIMGSSLGGLISHYAIYEYPNVFGKAGIFSPSYWVAPPVFAYTASRRLRDDTRIYFYAGGKEDPAMLPNMEQIIAIIEKQNFPRSGLRVVEQLPAAHNEAAWRAEFGPAVTWLFGND